VQNDTEARSFCGSLAYLAPEMLKRSGHGKAVDWYLFGVLLYEMIVGDPPYFSDHEVELLNNIQNAALKLPSSLSKSAKSLLTSLLNRNPQKRIGSGPRGAEDIKEHEFFKNINWMKVYNKEY
jgi:serine/threonine protein kinase